MIKYWTFSVLDTSENILNALEDIEQCVKVKIVFKYSPASFFEKEKHYAERIKRIKKFSLFNTGTFIKIEIGIPLHIHKKILAKKDKENEYRILLAQYTFGIKLCTIKEINETINRGIQ
jgi:hypothetical protein